MESIFYNKGKQALLRLYYLYKQSLLYKSFEMMFSGLRKLMLYSVIAGWLSSNHRLKNSLENRKLFNIKSDSLMSYARNVLIESKILTFFSANRVLYPLIFFNVFLYPFTPTAIGIIFSSGLCVLMLINSIVNQTFRKKSRLIVFTTLIFLCYLLLSLFFNDVRSDGLLIFITYTSILLFTALVTVTINDDKNAMILIHMITATVLTVSMYGLYQVYAGAPVDPSWLDESLSGNVIRIYSVFGNPNVFGEFLTLTLPIVFAGFNLIRNKKVKVAYGSIFLLGMLNVLLTFSRGSMLAIFIVMVMIVIFKDRKYLPVLVLMLLVSPLILPSSIIERVLTIFQGGDTSTSYRVSIYMASYDMLREHVFTGVGLGNFKVLYNAYAYSAAKSFHAHNTVLMVFIELGLMGLLAWLFMMFIWVREIFSAQKTDSAWSYYAFAAFAGVMGCTLQGMVDHIWHNYDILFFYFLMIALGFIASNIAKGQMNYER
ncbi:MAG: O-antigen ligase family protein [Dethiosulfatibacter sp.]|nr:O-antigen ligase family protein [Dethiosulfatibacter sp.]